jgi:hypothetical protein
MGKQKRSIFAQNPSIKIFEYGYGAKMRGSGKLTTWHCRLMTALMSYKCLSTI